jgi:DNA polymerase-2
VETGIPQDVPPLRDSLEAAGIDTFEADVTFATRYLIDRGVRGSIAIEGKPERGNHVDIGFENPEIRASDYVPRLSVLSIDIETDPSGRHLLSVALAGCGTEEVLLYTPRGYSTPHGATGFGSERDLLAAFVRRIREVNPDVLTGWNLIDFDLTILARLSEVHSVPLVLGRGPDRLRLRTSSLGRGAGQASLPGRVALDGIQLLRSSFVRLESYSLEAASREILKKGKTITGSDRVREILRLFREDRERLVEYNLTDARLVLEIFDRLHLLDLAIERTRLTGVPMDRGAASIASFDFLYLSELSRRGIAAPTARPRQLAPMPTSGGHVLDPRPGLYRNVLTFDFKSLYPSVIRTFQIDPLGFMPSPQPGDNAIIAPNGAAFRREHGILPGILDELFPRRERATQAGNRIASHAIKILMNSFYGVLGTPACRFASPALANAITGFGREILLWSKARFEARGYEVLYGDTDSLFVRSGVEDAAAAQRLGMKLCADINRELAEHVRCRWSVESRLELEFKTTYARFLLPAARHGSSGARKRYAGLVGDGETAQVVFTGMEAVRRDWTELAHTVQRELYTRLFHDRPVEEYLSSIVRELRGGRLDEMLVYRKSVRKSLQDYTATEPPHVAAARKLPGHTGSLIDYVITRSGPEPVRGRKSPLDYEHYVQKQVRPVAEPVLQLLGLVFERVIGDASQLRLF